MHNHEVNINIFISNMISNDTLWIIPVNEIIKIYFFMILVSAICKKEKVICHSPDFTDVEVNRQLLFVACRM